MYADSRKLYMKLAGSIQEAIIKIKKKRIIFFQDVTALRHHNNTVGQLHVWGQQPYVT